VQSDEATGNTTKRSTERILTTHTGSLPRPDDLVRMMFAREEGVPVDQQALAGRIRTAVMETVRRQSEAGIDMVNDGEAGKPSYATYVKDRLNGFDGQSYALQYADLIEFPDVGRRVFSDPGRSRRKAPACTGPISVRDPGAVQTDIDNLKAALPAGGDEAFLTAASPGVISLFFRDEHYHDHETYLYAIADAMKHEYQAVAAAGLTLQVDCPDLGMGRHIQFADLSLQQFRTKAQLHVQALNHALEGIPAQHVRLHLCWGNYEGPHHFDVPLRDVIDLVRGSQPTTRARVAAVREPRGAGGYRDYPRRDRFHDELHRASRAGSATHRALRQAGGPGERDRRHRLRFRDLGRSGSCRSASCLGKAGQPIRRGAPRVAAALVTSAIRST
jgi:5-methyltetrahydropteroyltriglutamate--homocysteine methyltransferase